MAINRAPVLEQLGMYECATAAESGPLHASVEVYKRKIEREPPARTANRAIILPNLLTLKWVLGKQWAFICYRIVSPDKNSYSTSMYKPPYSPSHRTHWRANPQFHNTTNFTFIHFHSNTRARPCSMFNVHCPFGVR